MLPTPFDSTETLPSPFSTSDNLQPEVSVEDKYSSRAIVQRDPNSSNIIFRKDPHDLESRIIFQGEEVRIGEKNYLLGKNALGQAVQWEID